MIRRNLSLTKICGKIRVFIDDRQEDGGEEMEAEKDGEREEEDGFSSREKSLLF